MPLNPRSSDLPIDQLRSLWLTNRNPDIRRVIEEVVNGVWGAMEQGSQLSVRGHY
ncbi:hypothetical protein PHO31112_01200 [Pandoraea horticolens]|uniref:Uncharacterized protein n=1 Tax=Pandoraea horticolens TaxID=2508298 RepID=A0A5E4T8Q5_9BURK|nr:hypothetical protein PHO31112_01200 [Pandoraea horticolens]